MLLRVPLMPYFVSKVTDTVTTEMEDISLHKVKAHTEVK